MAKKAVSPSPKCSECKCIVDKRAEYLSLCSVNSHLSPGKAFMKASILSMGKGWVWGCAAN